MKLIEFVLKSIAFGLVVCGALVALLVLLALADRIKRKR